MKRITWTLLLVCVGVAAIASPAWANDSTLEHALKRYDKSLTSDIAYLAGFSVPSRSHANATLHKLSKIGKDLSGATKAARDHQASSKNGRKGRSLVLSGLADATTAQKDAGAAARAARSGKHGTAVSDRKKELKAINKAIPLFESGGQLLHLY